MSFLWDGLSLLMERGGPVMWPLLLLSIVGHPDGGANLVLAQDGVAWISGSTARDDQRTSNE